MTLRDQRRVRAAAAALAVLGAGLLAGCSTLDDATREAQGAASSKAQEAVDGAKAKATELAVDAVKTEVCRIVKDGVVSATDARALDGLASTAEAAGAPKDLLALVRQVARQGTSATAGQVSDLRAKTCTS